MPIPSAEHVNTVGLPTIHVHLDSTRLSDLFFNFEHLNYENACRGQETREQQTAALLEDAKFFVFLLCGTTDMTLAGKLISDFYNRL